LITVDFETEGFVGNPILNAPKPVGVAIQYEDGTSEYTDDWNKLENVYSGREQLLFHNAPFDLTVAHQHLSLAMPKWDRVHDTMYQLYLKDPYARSLSLKPSAETYLGEPPEEQNAVKDWVMANVRGAKKSDWGAHISKAPRELVEPYALADVRMTRGIYDYLKDKVPQEAYDRERELSPILLAGTTRGIRVNTQLLGHHIHVYGKALEEVTERIRKVLKQGSGFNPGSGAQLAEALDECGLVTEWRKTPGGARSTAKDNLFETIEDKPILALLMYRSTLETCLGTFMLPWFELAKFSGYIHTSWNAVRSTEGKRSGTRTGRLSSSTPNFQNVPTEFDQPIPPGLPDLPLLRRYLLPPEGSAWVKRDFSSQEIRVLGHYEDGALCKAYQADPNMDPHALAQDLIETITGIRYPRKSVKIVGFGIVYGMGAFLLSKKLHCSVEEASAIKSAYLAAFPGIKELSKQVSRRGRSGNHITTHGGRIYYKEPSKMIGGKSRDFSYKLLNYLVQGSSADQTKQCIIDWDKARDTGEEFLATVHDEINISVPEGQVEHGMARLQDVMDQDMFDVPMRSEGFVGNNWQDIKRVD
jgi:DNA polymerase-1